MGRPTKYSEELLQKAEDYVNNYEKWGDVIPSIKGLARALGVHRDTLHAWARSGGKEAFSDTLEKLACMQEVVLLNKGLTGEFNAAMVKLALANHGYT